MGGLCLRGFRLQIAVHMHHPRRDVPQRAAETEITLEPVPKINEYGGGLILPTHRFHLVANRIQHASQSGQHLLVEGREVPLHFFKRVNLPERIRLEVDIMRVVEMRQDVFLIVKAVLHRNLPDVRHKRPNPESIPGEALVPV